MRVLITGAAGRLGRKLMVEFSQYGHEVVATDVIPSISRLFPGVRYLSQDLTAFDELDQLVTSLRPALIINAAAMTNVDACETNRDLADKINAEVPAQLAGAASRVSAQLIQVSTDYIFDGHQGPYAENAVPNPIGYYGVSKLAGEQAVLAESNRNAIVRTCVLFGYEPECAPDFVTWLLGSLRAGKNVTIVTDQYSTPTLTDSLALGIRLLADARTGGIFHLVGETYLNRYEFARMIASEAGMSDELIQPTDSSKFKQAAPRPMAGGLTTQRAQVEFGFQPLSVSMAMQQYFTQEATQN